MLRAKNEDPDEAIGRVGSPADVPGLFYDIISLLLENFAIHYLFIFTSHVLFYFKCFIYSSFCLFIYSCIFWCDLLL